MRLPAIVLALILAACVSPSETDRARQVADRYLEDHLGPIERNATVQNDGGNWLVTYTGPAGHAGGDIRVWVEKNDMTVKNFVGEQ